jgi:hypothetical protein
MRVFVTKWFDRFARKENLSATLLCGAVAREETSRAAPDLG